MRQSFQFKLFGCKRLKHLHGTIDVSAQIWNHSVALHRRYYKLFGKDSPKPSSRRTSPSCVTAGSRTGKRSGVRAFKLSLTAFISAGKRSSRATSSARRRSVNGCKYRSFTLKQAGYKMLGHGRIKILGRAYRFNQSRAITGLIKTVTVRRDALRDVYLTFSCDGVPQPEQAPKTGQSAGADFGLKTFLTLSSGERIAAPQPLKAELRHLRKAQRVLSRKQKGSKVQSPRTEGVARVHRRLPTSAMIGNGSKPGCW